ncbi:trans-aconitate 2-methyltransferase [Streptacidiphilus sp. PB12-B1b]|uniref:trans-aconitate 2-methyltransferase n=1 Tax=Streptacidiphilus sp. PB12-B1b TaxID=2705012 RepID=UPI0015FCE9AB|nr:trans-aconitate 2-methyltransferase [Streptacidiphilus sp. PB12-B1b]QMU79421.1 trans-aconitate 2-methyltransferase [Streptacidiphilus sp. PB12-B1b]
MTTDTWDPAQYLRHADHRSRPFHDLVARIPGTPQRVVDLGCGPGNTTATLPRRWPRARITGIDNSPAMIRQARHDHPDIDVQPGDITTHRPDADLILSNAALQWIPDHTRLFPRWIDALPAGGTLAFQVPGNFDQPSHTLLADLRATPRWAHLPPVHTPAVHPPAHYLHLLTDLGCTVDAWETTYLQLLTGDRPVLDWMLGTGLRPTLTALTDPADREAFLDQYAALLDRAYPATPHGTVLPYRRIFVIATKAPATETPATDRPAAN